MLEIFDALGNVRSDLDTMSAEIEALDDAKREKLFACLSANAVKREAEANLASARKTVRERESAYHDALTAHNRIKPQTHQEALADAIAAHNGMPKPSAEAKAKALADKVVALEKKARANRDKPEIEAELMAVRKEHAIAAQPLKTKAALQASNDALAVAQANLVVASRVLKDAERTNNAAIADWLAANTDRVTHESLVRAAAMRDAERALAAKAKEPAPTGPKQWPLEKNLIARGAEKSKRTYFGAR